MTSQTKEEFQPKEDPPTTITPDKKVKQEAVCCFCPLRPWPLILLLLITPIIVLGMYSAFYDPQYVYVIVAFGVPSKSGNTTDVQTKTDVPKADASVQTEGGVVTVKKFETVKLGAKSEEEINETREKPQGKGEGEEKGKKNPGKEKDNSSDEDEEPWDFIVGLIESITRSGKKD